MPTFRVNNQTQLDAAVRAVRGGDTIVLADGTYSRLNLDGFSNALAHLRNLSSTVTITSADPGDPAVINAMMLRSVRNVDVRNVTFDYDPSKTASKPFWIERVQNVEIDDVLFQGHVGNGGPAGLGLLVKGSQNVTIENSDFRSFYVATDITTSSNIEILNNDVRGMGHDSFTFASVNNVKIDNNYFGQYNSSDPLRLHMDSIQFRYRADDTASQNISIRNNEIDSSDMRHGIFFGNGKAQAGDMAAWYRNIDIEDNYLRSAHKHGITISHGDDVRIAGNVLVQNSDQGLTTRDVYVPLINVSNSSRNVVITENRVASVPDDDSPTWTVTGNVTSGRNLRHWEGSGQTLNAGGSLATSATRAAAVDTGQTSYVDGGRVDGPTSYRVAGLDLDEGDVLVLRNFEVGTFAARSGGNPVSIWDGGGAVRIDSVADIREIDAFSRDVSVQTWGDSLVLRVAQDDGVANVRIEDFADDYRAFQPELL